MSNPLYVFDLDHTLIDADCSTLWSRFLSREGLIKDPDYLAKEHKLMLDYQRGEMNIHEYVGVTLAPLAGMTIADVDTLVARCVETDVLPMVYPAAKRLIEQLHAQGQQMMIISASVSLLVKAIAPKLGIEHAIGIDLVTGNNAYTSVISGVPSYQAGKITRLKEWLQVNPEYSGELTFYTDSINDLPLCLEADKVLMVNPCQKLAAQGTRYGWQTLNWSL
ncbi:HAD family hydrolase [Cedecea neteri]|uniref:HAD-IB family hydrolase n=1 Tax=Cedecea neteri TaxID=158822 RepID=A0A291E5C6_9ENTR|nr:HAD family hydrolase [Cedecea neteri]ATF95099.1 HAD-IB family hydrolase [Cedecea neteri]